LRLHRPQHTQIEHSAAVLACEQRQHTPSTSPAHSSNLACNAQAIVSCPSLSDAANSTGDIRDGSSIISETSGENESRTTDSFTQESVPELLAPSHPSAEWLARGAAAQDLFSKLLQLQKDLAKPPVTPCHSMPSTLGVRRMRSWDEEALGRSSEKRHRGTSERATKLYQIAALREEDSVGWTDCRSIKPNKRAGAAAVLQSDDEDLPLAMSSGPMLSCTCCQDAFISAMEEQEEHIQSLCDVLKRIEDEGAVLESFEQHRVLHSVRHSWGAGGARAIAKHLTKALLGRRATLRYDEDKHTLFVLVCEHVECTPSTTKPKALAESSERYGLHICFVDVTQVITMADPLDDDENRLVALAEALATSPSTNASPSSLTAGVTTVRRSSRAARCLRMALDVFSEEDAFRHLLRVGYTAPARLQDDADRGRCVFAQSFIPRGCFVAEYKGQLIDADEAALREVRYKQAGSGSYVFHIGHNGAHCIDATAERAHYGIGRLINHSRVLPNVYPRKVVVDGVPRLVFFSRMIIYPETELLYDYGETNKDVVKALGWMDST
jgi:hypothetical protein